MSMHLLKSLLKALKEEEIKILTLARELGIVYLGDDPKLSSALAEVWKKEENLLWIIQREPQ